MDPAALMAMMGQQRKPEPWTWKAAGKALAGVTIVAAVGTYVWDSRGAPFGSIGEIKRAMAMCEMKCVMTPKILQAMFWELVAMTLFVYVSCGTAMAVGTAQYTGIAMSFGFAITTLVYVTAHTSGGHINCAVTFALALRGVCPVMEALWIVVAQVLGSVLASVLLLCTFKEGNDMTGGFATNALGPDVDYWNAMAGEITMTFLLCSTVFQTAVNDGAITRAADKSTPVLAPVAIGFAVFLAHMVLIAVDGCSINPTRSFGPALIGSFRYDNTFQDFEIFIFGPLIGAALAAVQDFFMSFVNQYIPDKTEEAGDKKDTAIVIPPDTGTII